MGRAYGIDAKLRGKFETSYGAPPGGDYRDLPFRAPFSLGSEQPLGEDDTLGQGREPRDPIRDVITVEGSIGAPLTVRETGIWLSLIFGAADTTAVAATGSITFAGNPAPGDTITINGAVFTFVAGSPTGNQIEIQGSLAATLAEAADVLNASVVAEVAVATYDDQGGDTLLIAHDTAGPGGNAFTLAASAATVSGPTLAGGGYAHVWTSGGDDLPSLALEAGHPKVPAFFMNAGVRGGTIAFEWTRRGGAAMTITVIGQSETRNASSQAGTPEAFAFERFHQFQGGIKRGGVALGMITQAQLTYSNELEAVEVIRDDGKIEDADPTTARASGRLEARFDGTDLLQAAENGTPVDLELTYTAGPGKRLAVTLPRVFLPKPKLPIQGAGGIQASYNFQTALDDGEGHSLQVTLVNDVPEYPLP